MDQLVDLLNSASTSLADHPIIAAVIGGTLLAVVALIADLVAKRQLVRLLSGLALRTRSTWDDALIEQRVFSRLAQCVPAVVIMIGAKWIPGI